MNSKLIFIKCHILLIKKEYPEIEWQIKKKYI